ncbi:MAG: hypothetical protein JO151_06420 [Verrucomicrobia bacterium]|nr:hypothetical protein [Verrucomicrobiota bacterium]
MQCIHAKAASDSRKTPSDTFKCDGNKTVVLSRQIIFLRLLFKAQNIIVIFGGAQPHLVHPLPGCVGNTISAKKARKGRIPYCDAFYPGYDVYGFDRDLVF